jgi:hypothetical protein
MLIDRGFVRVRPLLGGIEAWGDAGYLFEERDLPLAPDRLEGRTLAATPGASISQPNRRRPKQESP